jgi:hypothetical protein
MSSLRFSAGGTLVMPKVVPDPSFCDISAGAEWLEPERWSVPPPAGLSPIVPCDEPDEDDCAQVLTPIRTPVPPAWLAPNPVPSFAQDIARDPIVLPVSGWPKLVAAIAVASLTVLGAAATAAMLLV